MTIFNHSDITDIWFMIEDFVYKVLWKIKASIKSQTWETKLNNGSYKIIPSVGDDEDILSM